MDLLMLGVERGWRKSAAQAAGRARMKVRGCVCAFLVLVAGARAQEVWTLDNLKTVAGHPLALEGKPAVDTADGRTGLQFDGAHDGVFVPAIPIAGAKAFTIEVLFRPAEGGSPAQRFFHVQDVASRRALIEIRTDGKGGWWLDEFLRTDVRPTDKGLTLIDPTRVHPTNRWYWIAMRYDGKRLTAFLNGVPELRGEGDFSPLGEGKVSIGVRQNLVYWFKGMVGEVRFHREALPAEKLQRVSE